MDRLSQKRRQKLLNVRQRIIGIDQEFDTPYGRKPIVYADWVASGRMYAPIEEHIRQNILPFVGNTHTETSVCGTAMTKAYHEAQQIIKRHVNAGKNDVLICGGSGMTGVVNKFQRILGLKLNERYSCKGDIPHEKRPIVLCSHMEHHSNQTSWLETICDVVVVEPDSDGLVSVENFEKALACFQDREMKIAAVTSCSNVTGVFSPYHEIAELMHRNGGLCFVDFACSAPYVKINMHPENDLKHLDAVFFSPHKFLGGPGTSGVLVFDKNLYASSVPDNPGGGTVAWTNPWGEHKYFDDIEAREDGGTPGFLQTMRTAFAIQLKEEIGTHTILEREEELMDIVWEDLKAIDNVYVLADHIRERLAIISFYIDGLHYNLGVKMLNDRFGIQMRGGCACAGTYGHYLLDVDHEHSCSITDAITAGDLSSKPGWIRFSLHPTMTDVEAGFVLNAIRKLAANWEEWSKDYIYRPGSNEFIHMNAQDEEIQQQRVESWYSTSFIETGVEVDEPISIPEKASEILDWSEGKGV